MSRMTLSDRIEIEAGIYARKSLSEIAEQIHKSRRYVSEELRRNATKIPGEHPLGKRCRNATGCRRGGLCGKENCHQMCYTCKEVDCQTVCKAYNDDPCKELQKPPYVCNVCSRRRKCKSDRVYYTAQQADAVAKRRYAEARNKPQMQKEAMAALDALVRQRRQRIPPRPRKKPLKRLRKRANMCGNTGAALPLPPRFC